ncbi:MAG: NADPH-dependent F420 reductase [Bacteriovoracaceae bacterium]|nr:NADPH-dependent F420 reductase [Bacteriovoracaceae bacterium]
MKIGFIGTGNVGGALAKALGSKGHSIYLGTRDLQSEDVLNLKNQIGPNTSIHPINEIPSKADVIILATPWRISEGLVKSLADQMSNKILIDCTNPLKTDLSGLEIGHTSSGGEVLQMAAPGAKVFKAFNTTGFNIMESPVLESRKAVMFFCGDDKESRHIVQDLIKDVGFESIDAGPLSAARLLEPFALLWISSAYKFGLGRDFAFSLIRRKN